MKESDIQSTIIDYLFLRKHFFVRLNNIPPVQTVNGRMVFRRMPKGSMLGLPDIMVLWKGFPVFLEVKAEKGRLSEHQIEFKRRCGEQGIEYWVVRKIEDLQEIGL
jgi:hypothetical protein